MLALPPIPPAAAAKAAIVRHETDAETRVTWIGACYNGGLERVCWLEERSPLPDGGEVILTVPAGTHYRHRHRRDAIVVRLHIGDAIFETTDPA